MEPLTEDDVRASFVNCSRGEAKRANLPDLGATPWADLDFLGWTDPKAPTQAYLVAPTERWGLVGVKLRANRSGGRPRMCSVCTTTHSGQGASLMAAARAGKAGRDGNTVGLDICTDLTCSAYARGLIPLPTMSAAHETLTVEQRVDRLRRNLAAFLARVQR